MIEERTLRRSGLVAAAFLAGCSSGRGGSWIGHAPVAVPDAYVAVENVTLAVPRQSGLLANDEYAATAKAVLISPPTLGSLALATDGSFVFVPPPAFFGSIDFQYAAETERRSQPSVATIDVRRDFGLAATGAPLDVVQGTAGTVVVSVAAVDAVVPPPVVNVAIVGLPAGVTALGGSVTAGNSIQILLQTTPATPQIDWTTVSVQGTLGSQIRSVPLQLRVRGPPGAIDTTFGSGSAGEAIWQATGDDYSAVLALAVQPDGRILAAGNTTHASIPHSQAMLFARLLPSGLPDGTFGAGGVAYSARVNAITANHLALEPDGRILFSGDGEAGFSNIYIGRLSTSGVLDPTFAGAGLTEWNVASLLGMASGSSFSAGLRLLPSGKIVAVGSSDPEAADGSPWVGRFLPTGAADPGFGVNGYQAFPFLGLGSSVGAAVLDSAGRIDVVGRPNGRGFGVARLTSNAELDATFGGTGVVTTTSGSFDHMYGITVGPSGEVIAVGSNNQNMIGFALDGAGLPIASFGSSGLLVINAGGVATASAVEVDAQGRAVIAGLAGGDAALARVLPDGSPDAAFNGGGAYRDYGFSGTKPAMVFDAQGRILISIGASSGPARILRIWN